MSKTAVDAYFANFSGEALARLAALRTLVRQVSPEAIESMSYGMPAYKLAGKPLVYFAAYPKHIGVYATPNSHHQFVASTSQYKQGKGSIQFPHDQDLPLKLIQKMVEYRRQEILNG
ncbi:DUF1801 domain-containing protein [Candidatus Saccharibacteria bacterium]|nr:DUF1801 domain-containing protein [Candidatus Saccharibacteria bacterium]MCB9821458.1 DUF1801 domain-containing protein [Candidatus Nomurabacteria bacterium]